jgi:hypothetical protein
VAALENLHFGMKPAMVHNDVTIFVEADMRACLGDFGLSLLLASPDACAMGGHSWPRVLHRAEMRPVDVGKERRDLALANWVVPKIQVGEWKGIRLTPIS